MNNTARNTIGILLGLLVSMIIIIIGVTLNSEWIRYEGIYDPLFPFRCWQQLVKDASMWFFVALLVSGGISTILGGIVTAIVVKQAKTAYAILLGFILYLMGLLDSWITPGHPMWYNIIILFILFPFSWMSGKIVDYIFNKFRKKSIFFNA